MYTRWCICCKCAYVSKTISATQRAIDQFKRRNQAQDREKNKKEKRKSENESERVQLSDCGGVGRLPIVNADGRSGGAIIQPGKKKRTCCVEMF